MLFYRYIAVHYPLDYSQAMHEANALTIRIFKYVSVVVLITCIFTFTKFLEGEVNWVERNDTTDSLPGYDEIGSRNSRSSLPNYEEAIAMSYVSTSLHI